MTHTQMLHTQGTTWKSLTARVDHEKLEKEQLPQFKIRLQYEILAETIGATAARKFIIEVLDEYDIFMVIDS